MFVSSSDSLELGHEKPERGKIMEKVEKAFRELTEDVENVVEKPWLRPAVTSYLVRSWKIPEDEVEDFLDTVWK